MQMNKIEKKDVPDFCKSRFLKFLYTGILQGILSIIIGISDMVIVGFFFGAEGVSAIAVTGPLGFLAGFLVTVFTSGCRIKYSEKVGEYDQEAANRYFSTALTSAVVITLFFLLLMVTSGERYFDLYRMSGDILDMARKYLTYYKYVFVFSPIVFFIGQMVYSDGDVKLSSIANCIYFAGNIILSVIFAITIGIEGVGLGTLVSGLACLVTYCLHFFKKECALHYRRFYSVRMQLEISRFSIMDSLYPLFSGINGVIVSMVIVEWIGSDYLAVNSVVGQVLGMTGFFSVATEAMLPLFNSYRGEGNIVGERKVIRITGKTLVIMAMALTAAVFLTSPVIPSLFSLSDPQLAASCSRGVRIVATSFVFHALLALLTTYYNSVGKVIFATVIARLKDSVVYVICFVLFGYFFGANGLWVGTMLCPVITFLFVLLILRIVSKKDESFFLPREDDHVRSWNLFLEESAAMEVRNEASEYLSQRKVLGSTRNKAELLIEEVLLMIREHNDLERRIQVEVTILCRNDVEIIFRDDGELFDISDDDAELLSFRHYILTSLYQKTDCKDNITTMSFNRTRFVLMNRS